MTLHPVPMPPIVCTTGIHPYNLAWRIRPREFTSLTQYYRGSLPRIAPSRRRHHDVSDLSRNGKRAVVDAYWAIAFTKFIPFGVPTPVTLSHPGPTIREESVPNVTTNHRVENGLL